MHFIIVQWITPNGNELARLSFHVHSYTCLFGIVYTSEYIQPPNPYLIGIWSFYIGPARLTYRWRIDDKRSSKNNH